jgi:SAM-dependent methyltransferase
MRTPGDWSERLTHSGEEAPRRFAALSALFDPGTIRHLMHCGVARGWSCLELGGGGGSIAAWLCDRVGVDGEVVVTDVDTRFLETLSHPALDVRRHDAARDPLPDRSFDLIHTRLVLNHLPERDSILEKLSAALKPGGWLVVEEFDSASAAPDPLAYPGEVLLKTYAAIPQPMARRGVDRRYGRLLFGRLRDLGLASVGAEARTFMIQGGSPGSALVRATCERLRQDMIDAGEISEQEFADDMARLDDPDFLMPSAALWAVWGRRPLSPEFT